MMLLLEQLVGVMGVVQQLKNVADMLVALAVVTGGSNPLSKALTLTLSCSRRD